MYFDYDNNELPFNFKALLTDSVARILADEDPQRFLQWLQDHLHEYDDSPGRQLLQDPGLLSALAVALWRVIWNAMPLPGNHFRPLPIAEPGRNERCPCGSGRRYRLCCANSPRLPPLDDNFLWPLVVKQLPAQTVEELIGGRRLPIQALLIVADNDLKAGQARKAVRLLAPLFGETIPNTDEFHDFALNLLCNAYDELGYYNKKLALINHVIGQTRRSPLRSGAWQRLATIRIDNGDIEGAWAAFHRAQRDDPDSLGIGILEVQLLMATDQVAQARARAQFWVKRMQRQGLDANEAPLEFMIAMARDPIQAMAGVGMEIAGDAGQRLQWWLETVRQRPVPIYQVAGSVRRAGEGADGDIRATLKGQLLGMGLPEEQVDQALARLDETALGEGDHELPDDGQAATLFLCPPAPIAALDAQWHDRFPLAKPFSVHDEPFAAEDIWDPVEEDAWMTFLERHPEAFDSIDILDDVATACVLHAHYTTRWLDEVLLEPVLKRIEAIVHSGFEGVVSPRLKWGHVENRAALRNLARLAELYRRGGKVAQAQRVMDTLLMLNPGDNHGFRVMLMNERLRKGDDSAALALADRYPDDTNGELLYGRVLALYRLDRLGEARTAVREAVQRLPKIVRYLSRKRVRQPKLHSHGYSIDGDDQAWIYRREMRDVWASTPGALEWLKKQARQLEGL